MQKKWMIYGATGYTGKLIVKEAKERGLTPILAGRNEHKLKQLTEDSDLEYRVFDLDKRVTIAEQLQDIDVVLHCAGPFSATAKPMMAGCLNSHTHYLDITGEIGVFQHAKQLSKSAETAGIVLCPGVGFDVIPTDCVAATLKQAVPDAKSLWLGFSSRSSFSPGTAKTSVEGLAGGGKVRRGGNIITVPLAYKTRNIDFGNGVEKATTIPWGDVATAYYSTEIPNIEVYIPMPEAKIKQMKRLDPFRNIFAWGWVQRFLKNKIDAKVHGPSLEKRNNSSTYVWGEVINAAGEVKTARVVTSNGYDLTVTGSLGIVEHLLNKEPKASGFKTPSMLMGAAYVTTLPGCSEITLS